MKYENVIMELK